MVNCRILSVSGNQDIYTLEEMTITFDGEGDNTKDGNNETRGKETSFARNENIYGGRLS